MPLPGRNFFISAVALWTLGSVPAEAAVIQVTIDQLVFAPMEIEAKVGDTVEWTNKDIIAHTATVRDDWDVTIPANKSASIVLRKAGAVEYYCRFHPNMKGRIIVNPK